MARATAAPSSLFPWPSLGWEYQDIAMPYDGSWDDELNKLGADGWQVVSIIHDETLEAEDKDARVIVMRPRAAHPQASNVRKREGRKGLKEALADLDRQLEEGPSDE